MSTLATEPAPGITIDDDTVTAFYWMAGGGTSEDQFDRAADTSRWEPYRTAEGLEALMDREPLFRLRVPEYQPGDALVAEKTAHALSIAEAMARLENVGWTPEKVRSALSEHDGQALRVLAAVTA